MSVDARAVAPVEPVLDIGEIQGNALPGFMKPHMILVALAIGDGEHDDARARAWLAAIAPRMATLAEVMASRVRVRAARTLRPDGQRLGVVPTDDVWVNVALSYRGLARLARGRRTLEAELDEFEDAAFRLGLAARSSLLGDPTDPGAEGNPRNWVVGGSGREPHILLIVAADRGAAAESALGELRRDAAAAGLRVLHEQVGAKFDTAGAEHFGFQDGVSQPGVRGRLSDAPGDFMGHRTIDPNERPDCLLYGLPGQLLIWPGEFVFGYQGVSADPLVPGPIKQPGPAWSRNGSYVVYRRLRQDVAAFWRFIEETGRRLRTEPGFEDWTDDRLAAALVGRWKSGAPLVRAPRADDTTLGHDRQANNIFGFATTAGTVRLTDGTTTNGRWPDAVADPIGLVCPLGSHIRKVNARESANDFGGARASLDRRILRRGLPFGPVLDDPSGPDAAAGDRGLLFVSYQSSIVDQFEFLTANWMNSPVNPRSPGGFDMLVGQNGHPGQGRRRHCTLFGRDLATIEVATDQDFVIATGGGYFFSPSISALRGTLGPD
jgi:Dyp-type peroxidase family